ncbi:hypothetical protein HRbin22_02482 [Candidatus Thermoflexus japonica]|uniref:Response regulatory domain-containing protein n=1 Tax=Candidatus Thermoflexus japonica TaxID=2035417 RepID=A0A2H5Y9T7_9CHLR|nr:hypothetical protein HRbin22_02482 [Candidatus Thermoflexus japonica]
MTLRMLLAIASPVFLQTIRRIADLAAQLLPWPVEIDEAVDSHQLEKKLTGHPATLLLLDWDWGRESIISLIPRLFEWNPSARVVVLLPPGAPKAYRVALWEAGACVSTPRDRLDEEWLATVLCLVRRAMEREGILPGDPQLVSQPRETVRGQANDPSGSEG